MEDAPVIRQQVTATILFITLALIFSLGLPAAGMVNHLLATGEPTVWRALLLWLIFSLLCIFPAWLLKPLIYHRVKARHSRQTNQQS